jgi:hypothetical protein
MKIDGASDALEFIDIWYRVFAYMRWPEDEQRRRAHIATAFVGGLDAAETMERPGDMEPELFDVARGAAYDALMADFKELGGFSSLRPFSGIQRSADNLPVKDWGTAAMVLMLVRAIDAYCGSSSINKAIFLIERDKGKSGCQKNRLDIRRAWTRYKIVAHLAAALFIWLPMGHEFDLAGLTEFLSIARDFQRFGTGFFAYIHREPLLDPLKIWSVPEDFPAPDCPNTLIPELDTEGIASLRLYRAPQ